MFDFILQHLTQINQTFQIILALLTIEEWVRRLRKRTGLTQEAFAEQLGVAVRSVPHREQGDRKPRGENIQNMQMIETYLNNVDSPSPIPFFSTQEFTERLAEHAESSRRLENQLVAEQRTFYRESLDKFPPRRRKWRQ